MTQARSTLTVAGHHDPVNLYRDLALHRAAAARLESLREQGHIPAAARCGRGYEAVSVGAARALRSADDGTGDAIALTAHNTGALFAFGGTPLELFRQHLARGSAPSRGRETDVCYTAFDRGLVGPVALPGTMVEVMAGVTLAFRLRGEPRVGLVFSGEDETSTSAWHEGINFAAVQRCPLIVLVQAGDGTSSGSHTRARGYARKAPGYGIASESVDGADVLEVHRAVRAAARRARSGKGASLVEARGCPVAARARPDHGPGAAAAEREDASDPLGRLRARLIEAGKAEASDLDEVERHARASVREACEQALAESAPAAEQALGGVYTDDFGSPPWYRLDPPTRGLAQAAAH